MTVAELDKKYNRFMNKQSEAFDRPEYIDYLCISMDSIQENELSFRIYQAASAFLKNRLVQQLQGRNMVCRFERVIGERDNSNRYDIALTNRTDNNMVFLLSELESAYGFLADWKKDIWRSCSMQITDMPGYVYSSFYHLGISEKNGCDMSGKINPDVEAIKLYFLTRWCKNPDAIVPGKDYRDNYYMDIVKKNLPDRYVLLKVIAEKILKICPCHLWMYGVDFLSNNQNKRKLYFKNERKDLSILENACRILSASNNERIRILNYKAETVNRWMSKNLFFQCRGISIGEDNSGRMYMNVYYTLRNLI